MIVVIAACNASIDVPAELAIGGIWDLVGAVGVASVVASVKKDGAEFDSRKLRMKMVSLGAVACVAQGTR